MSLSACWQVTKRKRQNLVTVCVHLLFAVLRPLSPAYVFFFFAVAFAVFDRLLVLVSHFSNSFTSTIDSIQMHIGTSFCTRHVWDTSSHEW